MGSFAANTFNEIILIIGIVFGATIYSLIALTSTFWVLQYSGLDLKKKKQSTEREREQSISIGLSAEIGSDSNPSSIPDDNHRTSQKQRMSQKRKSSKKHKHAASNRSFIPSTVLNQISSQRLYDDGTPRPENVLKHHQ